MLLLKSILEVLKGGRNIFRHFRQRLEVFGKSSEMFGNSGNDQVNEEFDSEKVGRHT